MDLTSFSPSTDWLVPAHWRAIDFVSDLHLHAEDAATFKVWQQFLQQPLHQRADALCILGDLFEVWIGDDVLQSTAPSSQNSGPVKGFWPECTLALRTYSENTPVFFMHGNRDFLLGTQALNHCGMHALVDPTVLVFQGSRWLLSHGDALCLDDTEYMQFRTMVRQPAWQRDFLARPLDEREAVALQLRQQSQAHKAAHANDPAKWADVDTPAARAALLSSVSTCLIHGHTHRPALHDLGNGLQRVVLSDWDLNAQPPRAQVLRLDRNGLHRRSPLSIN